MKFHCVLCPNLLLRLLTKYRISPLPPRRVVIYSSIAASQPSLLDWLHLDSATCYTAPKRTHSRLDNDVQYAQLCTVYISRYSARSEPTISSLARPVFRREKKKIPWLCYCKLIKVYSCNISIRKIFITSKIGAAHSLLRLLYLLSQSKNFARIVVYGSSSLSS